MNYRTFLFLLLIGISASAQKPISIRECEELFLKNNLMLLAEQWQVDMSKAAILQAKIWELPYLSGELNAFNPEASRMFDIGQNGQKVFAVQQLIYLGGKKKKEIELAKTSSQAAELELEDLLRNLRYELKRSFYTLHFKQTEIEITDRQIANLDTLIKAYRVQAAKGNIPLKDLVRLQSLFFNLKNQRTDLLAVWIEENERLKLMTGLFEDFVPQLDPLDKRYTVHNPEQFSVDTLSKWALEHRPDFLLTQKNIERSIWNLRWQKSLAVPDLTVGAAYDQRGGAFVNQTNLVVGIPLPLWNRNKGNIKMAESQVKQSEVYQSFAQDQIRTEVSASYKKWVEAYANYQNLTQSNLKDFEDVYEGAVKNFRKNNITIIEFSDFMESINMSMMQFNEMKRNLVLSSEEVNKTVHSIILY